MGSKTLLTGYRLTQVVMYNGRKTVVFTEFTDASMPPQTMLT